MTIDATLLGMFIVLLIVIVAVIAYGLARRKGQSPVLITALCVVLCLAPPFAMLALLILTLWRDMPASA